MKKLMFLTMMFGLMVVFTGSISAQERPGKLEPNCAGKLPKVGMWVRFRIVRNKGEAMIFIWDKSNQTKPFVTVCTMFIDVAPRTIESLGANYYYATVDFVAKNLSVLKNGYRVKWQPTRTGDLYSFTTADGTEVGFLNANLNNQKDSPKR